MPLKQITLKTTRKGDERLVTWNQTAYHCPNCGAQTVWQEDGEGDYYAGPEHGCLSCRHVFSMPGGPEESAESGAQILAVIADAFPPPAA